MAKDNEIAQTAEVEAADVEADTKTVLPPTVIAHYTPASDAERALDKRVNWKLDLTVLLVLAISFIVGPSTSTLLLIITAVNTSKQLCGIDKTNIGFVATSSFVRDANLHPDDIPNSLSLVRPPFPPPLLSIPPQPQNSPHN